MGSIAGPMEVWLAHRSLATLHLRMELGVFAAPQRKASVVRTPRISLRISNARWIGSQRDIEWFTTQPASEACTPRRSGAPAGVAMWLRKAVDQRQYGSNLLVCSGFRN
jgi:hypothetical protein